MRNLRQIFYILPLVLLFSCSFIVGLTNAQVLSRVELFFSPRTGSFTEGSTFQIPILINTNGKSINSIDVKIRFDQNKLSIVDPSSGVSIIGVWISPPAYDNNTGIASYKGEIPNGIITDSGLVGMITFRAKSTGKTVVSVDPSSKITLNDGQETQMALDIVRAEYNILPKASEGVIVYSATHPVQENWYNNNSPVLSWERDPDVIGFSFELDNKPNTIPDNVIDSNDATKSFDSIGDGLWYFHIKANKAGVWSTTGHFLLRIDTVPPVEFKPNVNFLAASVLSSERSLVSFFTADNLSGIDHYEVGVINKLNPQTESPIFVQAESPYQVIVNSGDKLEVIVRAIDKAGNVRDESIDVRLHSPITNFFKDYPVYILLGVLFVFLILLILHFLVGHHVWGYIGKFRQFIKKEKIEEAEKLSEVNKLNS